MNKSVILKIAVIVIGIIFLLFYTMIPNQSAKVLEPKSNFEVIDTYKGCELLRWNNHQLAEYKYFLYCKDTKND